MHIAKVYEREVVPTSRLNETASPEAMTILSESLPCQPCRLQPINNVGRRDHVATINITRVSKSATACQSQIVRFTGMSNSSIMCSEPIQSGKTGHIGSRS